MLPFLCQTCGTGPDYVPPKGERVTACPDCGAPVALVRDERRTDGCDCEFCREWPLASRERASAAA